MRAHIKLFVIEDRNSIWIGILNTTRWPETLQRAKHRGGSKLYILPKLNEKFGKV